MAGNYFVVDQNRDVQVLGSRSVLDVMYVGIRTRPTDMYLCYPVPYELWNSGDAGSFLEALATGAEQMVSQGFAVGGTYVQDVGQNGLLTDYVEFTVQWTDPTGIRAPMTTTARVPEEWFVAAVDPFTFFLIGDAEKILSDAKDRLAATAAL